MTAPYKYESEPYTEYFSNDNWVNSALDYLGGNGRIGDFRYAPLIGPDILSGILVQATGQSVLSFANENLFLPLDISVGNNIVFQNKEEQLAWYNKTNVRGWVSDKSGVNTAGWGLNLTTEAMAKIGQLCLNNGVWEGQQIVSADWIQESTMEHSRCEQWNLSYGYLWWVVDKEEHIFAAMGDGGNTIYVNAKKKLVVAIASHFVPNAKDSIKLIREYIEPTVEFCP
jgi:CubicO group peptidase (beta-lactamase class C family)